MGALELSFIPELNYKVDIDSIIKEIDRRISRLDYDNKYQIIEFSINGIDFEIKVSKNNEYTSIDNLYASNDDQCVIASLENELLKTLSKGYLDLATSEQMSLQQSKDIRSEQEYSLLHEYAL